MGLNNSYLEEYLNDDTLYMGELIAFRSWTISPNGKLSGHMSNIPWKKGANTAKCILSARQLTTTESYDHDDKIVPFSDCSCGFYGFFLFSKANRRFSYSGNMKIDKKSVLGISMHWGSVEIHEHGLRSQYAQVLALLEPPKTVEIFGKPQPYEVYDYAQLSSKEYDIPVVGEKELINISKQYGNIASEEMFKGEDEKRQRPR